ncbi:MAG: hypothetical protein COB30_015350 [Ectothiorhodospiraceae bacterium]|nr:hypothetical protein [Ectothiorhodospiraceae bacterium]
MTDQPHVEKTPEILPEQAADLAGLELLADDMGEPGIPGSEPEPVPEPPAIPTKDLINPLVSLVCGSLAPAWEITEGEQSQLAEAYAAVVDKYFPDGLPMGPEIGALMITAAIVLPRLGKPMQVEPEPEPEGKPVENK